MRTVMIGLVVGSMLGLFAGLATSRYASLVTTAVGVHQSDGVRQSEAPPADSRRWDI